MSNNTVISGTIKELLARGLTFNGVLLDQPAMSVITRLGNGSFCRPIQKISSGKQGKPSTVWEFDTDGTFAFAAAAVVETVAVETVAVTVNPETLVASDETVASEVVSEDAVPATEAVQEAVEATATKPQRNRNRANKAKTEAVTAEVSQETATNADEMDAPLAEAA